jgi:nicotinamidase-related amidase
LPIFHVIHGSQDPNSKLHQSHPGFQIKEALKPIGDELLIIKNVNSAFIATTLKDDLESRNINKLVIVGLTTNHCISTTTRLAANLGFDAQLVADATATFGRKGINRETFSSEIIHQTTLANLQEEFAEIINTDMLLDRL